MLIKLLPEDQKMHLLDLAKLLTLCDKPLLWNGLSKDELTSDTDLDALSIQQGERENELLSDLVQSVASRLWPMSNREASIENMLKEKLKASPLIKIDTVENRVQAAMAVLKTLLEEKCTDAPAVPKIILFQLILVALLDGKISTIKWSLLKEIQRHYQLQDFIFEDLLERAEALNNEMSKIISLVLE